MNTYWYRRGSDDAHADRAPLFRNTRSHGIHAVGEVPPSWTDDDERTAGESYLAGYSRAYEEW